MMNFKKYYSPTPIKMRKLGDAFLACAGIVGVTGIFGFDKLKEIYTDGQIRLIFTVLFVFLLLGKFLTNFFVDDSVVKGPIDAPKPNSGNSDGSQ